MVADRAAASLVLEPLRAGLQRGETLLVHGGTSGIGVTAIQLGKAMGATVLATAGSAAKCQACREIGADHAIDYRAQDFAAEALRLTNGRGVDVVLDMVAGDYVAREVTCLAEDGRIAIIAVQGGTKSGFDIEPASNEAPRYALLGVRSCELHAMAIQDKVFLGGRYVDPVYRARRDNVFTVAVNCAEAGGTCFCVSMNTGPKATAGYDLALTEIIDGGRHYFVAEAGSDLGRELLAEVEHGEAASEEQAAAEAATKQAAAQMERSMDTAGLRELLYRNYENPSWDAVAGRCLTCGNCTMVCPTCFCVTVEDTTDLTGEHVERWRRWDSCFTTDFSYIHGGSIRWSPKSRYRQWMTHKLATWIDQFGSSGCVGWIWKEMVAARRCGVSWKRRWRRTRIGPISTTCELWNWRGPARRRRPVPPGLSWPCTIGSARSWDATTNGCAWWRGACRWSSSIWSASSKLGRHPTCSTTWCIPVQRDTSSLA